jgi:hypothetical protein
VLDLEFNRQLIFRQCSKSVIDFEIGNGDGEETTGEQKFVCLFFFKVFLCRRCDSIGQYKKKVLKPSILDLHEKLKSVTGK